jgi:superfamily I DNA/RNA helicase
MKTLPKIVPTREQLLLISDPRPGVKVIRGAAGSGKTTTALLMLKLQSKVWLDRKKRQNLEGDVNILVLTFNRTLRGYIEDLAQAEIEGINGLNLTILTFAKWALSVISSVEVDTKQTAEKIKQLAKHLPLPEDFLYEEIDYLTGRFLPSRLDEYLNCERVGRGRTPRVEKELRKRIIEEVINPYSAFKKQNKIVDWNDLPGRISEASNLPKYQIIIADETQDFSANQMRAIMKCAANPSTVIFVMDAAQRIYPRGFVWNEVGIIGVRNYRLKENHRNTVQICRFAKPLFEGLDIGDNGSVPDLDSCKKEGPMPVILKGRYSQQVAYAIDFIKSYVDLSSKSVGFMHPKGWGWFDYLKSELCKASLEFVEITREDEWPKGPENIALSTMHSGKGLEFDHVFLLGFNDETTPHGNEEGDATLESLRRTLAMAITRARESVILGYKPGEASSLIQFLDKRTYREQEL